MPHAQRDNAMHAVETLFDARGWRPFEFQRHAWKAYLEGRSGLVHAPTGMGKSLAVWLGPVIEALRERGGESRPGSTARGSARPLRTPAKPASRRARDAAEPIRVLWITPMRALATDTVRALSTTVEALELPWTVERRTGDTSSSLKLKQRERLPSALVTTPESLSLLLSYPGARDAFNSLRCVIVDEWHELLSTKRGTQTELCLARLRGFVPALRTWGLSATLGNLDRARDALLGASGEDGVLIGAPDTKQIAVRTILPPSIELFPWAGHLGLRLLPLVVEQVERASTTLLFTNTRSQTELWFRALIEARPDWIGRVAIHHGSLDREVRGQVEQLLREGRLLCVVCTSSLDLGVDFSPVEQVMQVGSPKGVARLLQRAGRSGHQPGAVSTVVCVPTNALELIEFAAARGAAGRRDVEPRDPLCKPLDVLVQHLVTIGLSEPFDADRLYEEVRSADAYRTLTQGEWEWCLDFVTRGGSALAAYPQYARLVSDEGRLRVASRVIERMHRLNIGTINSDTSIKVQYVAGKVLGTIEESFVARLKPGDRFVFGGRPLELVRVRQMTAQVKVAKSLRGAVARWDGGRTPLSTQLAHAVRHTLVRAALDPVDASNEAADPEIEAVRPLLQVQARWSRVPGADELLIESLRTREGCHAFLFPFEGRLVHEGIGALLAHRLAKLGPRSIAVTANDWGIELLSADPLPEREAQWRSLLSLEGLLDDLLSCLNATELTRRQFRDIARVAGLVVPGYPGMGKSAKQLQASSELFYDVLSEYDPANELLAQAKREVLEQQLEVGRLRGALERSARQSLVLTEPPRLTPLSFALWAESIRTQQVSSEKWSERVRKMVVLLEREAED